MSQKTCGPCQRDNKDIDKTSVWCIECEEWLCHPCQKSHTLNKMTQDHHLVEANLLAMESVSALKLSEMQKCVLHQNQTFDTYCMEDDVLCCTTCVTERHKTCNRVLPLEIAAKDIKSSKTVEKATEKVNVTAQVLRDIHRFTSTNIENLHRNEIEIKNTLESLQVNIVNQTNALTDKLKTDLEHIKKVEKEKLEKQLEFIDSRAKAIEARKRHMNFIMEHGSEIHTFILAHTIKLELEQEEKNIKKTMDGSRTVCIKLKEKKGGVDSFNTFGAIEVLTEPLSLQYKSLTKVVDEIKMEQPSSQPIKSLKLYTEFEVMATSSNIVSGICITDSDILLLCTRGLEKLFLYSLNGKQKGEIELHGNPFNVDFISTSDKAVVTLPELSKLELVDIYRKHDSKDIIQLPECCWSVTVIADKVIIAGGFEKIYMLDTFGVKLEEIRKPESGRVYAICYSDDQLLYCSDVDFKNAKVYCITEDGDLVYCFNNSNLKTPTGIALDRLRNVYISDLDSNNVQRYTISGHILDVVLTGCHITEPRAICFNKTASYMAVSNNGGRSVCLFECIH